MLKKRERLTKQAFDTSFKTGRRHHSTFLQIIHDKNDSAFHGAVVVGKKVYKRAVDRNRLRRQLYGILYRTHQEQTLSGTYILIAKPPIKNTPRKQISEIVRHLVTKITG